MKKLGMVSLEKRSLRGWGNGRDMKAVSKYLKGCHGEDEAGMMELELQGGVGKQELCGLLCYGL